MSRCTNCNLSFDEENGWQEFCALACAKEHFTRGKKGAALVKAFKDFDTWLANPKNARTVRLDGEKASPPKIGKFVDRTYSFVDFEGKGKDRRPVIRTYKTTENVGSKIVLRPITDDERRVARSWRGRGGFGENHHPGGHENLPGKYGKVGQAWFPHDE